MDSIIRSIKDILGFLSLNSSHAAESAGGYVILLKVIAWGILGFVAIYFANKFLGKIGAIVTFLFGLLVFAIVNGLIPGVLID